MQIVTYTQNDLSKELADRRNALMAESSNPAEADTKLAVDLGRQVVHNMFLFRRLISEVYISKSYKMVVLGTGGDSIRFDTFDAWFEMVCQAAHLPPTTKSSLSSLANRILSRISAGRINNTLDDVLSMPEGNMQRVSQIAGAAAEKFADDPDQGDAEIEGLVEAGVKMTREQLEAYADERGLVTKRNEKIVVAVVDVGNNRSIYYTEPKNSGEDVLFTGALGSRVIFKPMTVQELLNELMAHVPTEDSDPMESFPDEDDDQIS